MRPARSEKTNHSPKNVLRTAREYPRHGLSAHLDALRSRSRRASRFAQHSLFTRPFDSLLPRRSAFTEALCVYRGSAFTEALRLPRLSVYRGSPFTEPLGLRRGPNRVVLPFRWRGTSQIAASRCAGAWDYELRVKSITSVRSAALGRAFDLQTALERDGALDLDRLERHIVERIDLRVRIRSRKRARAQFGGPNERAIGDQFCDCCDVAIERPIFEKGGHARAQRGVRCGDRMACFERSSLVESCGGGENFDGQRISHVGDDLPQFARRHTPHADVIFLSCTRRDRVDAGGVA